MQVFVPYKNPLECAAVLDARRLNKQILECRQILAAIRGESSAWRNHPCTKMYATHAEWLECYQHCLECYKSYQDLYNVDFDEAMQDYRLAEGWNEDAAAITPPSSLPTSLSIITRRASSPSRTRTIPSGPTSVPATSTGTSSMASGCIIVTGSR